MTTTLKVGDDRVHSQAGLKALFNSETGFSIPERPQSIELEITMNPNDVWDFYKDIYTVSMLPQTIQSQWRGELTKLALKHSDGHKILRFNYPMLKFTARKLPLNPAKLA